LARSFVESKPTARVRAEIEIEDPSVLLALAGPDNGNLRAIAHECGVDIGQRGSVLLVSGESDDVAAVERFLTEAALALQSGATLTAADCVRGLRMIQADPSASVQEMFEPIVLVTPGHRRITPKSPAQKRYVEAIRAYDLTFGVGPAGTGKTYLAMAMAVQALSERRIKRIILARPAVEAGERLGFLPGDLAEKVNPYLRPLYDALHDMMDFDKAQALIQRGQIEVAPLAFMRGRTLNDSFVILDEAQNSTSEQMRMFLTRLGHSSKAIVTGDVTQVDLPNGLCSGLAEARVLLRGIDGIAFCEFTEVDVVRHPLVQKIIVAYETRDAERRREENRGRDTESKPGPTDPS
jgi:phosphate starvation-inducible protein PhoH and related proteins